MLDHLQSYSTGIAISSREASHHFSQYLEQAFNGQSFTVMKHGKPMARLVPVGQSLRTPKEQANRARKIALAQSFSFSKPYVGKFNRDDAYEGI